jgi:hypothetical protein
LDEVEPLGAAVFVLLSDDDGDGISPDRRFLDVTGELYGGEVAYCPLEALEAVLSPRGRGGSKGDWTGLLLPDEWAEPDPLRVRWRELGGGK